MTLEKIAKACNGIYIGDESLKQTEITGVEKDSRLIEEGYLYLPFVGQRLTDMTLFHRYLKKVHYALYLKKNWISTSHTYWLNLLLMP